MFLFLLSSFSGFFTLPLCVAMFSESMWETRIFAPFLNEMGAMGHLLVFLSLKDFLLMSFLIVFRWVLKGNKMVSNERNSTEGVGMRSKKPDLGPAGLNIHLASFCFIANQWHYLSGLLPPQLQNKILLGSKETCLPGLWRWSNEERNRKWLVVVDSKQTGTELLKWEFSQW